MHMYIYVYMSARGISGANYFQKTGKTRTIKNQYVQSNWSWKENKTNKSIYPYPNESLFMKNFRPLFLFDVKKTTFYSKLSFFNKIIGDVITSAHFQAIWHTDNQNLKFTVSLYI